MDDSVLAPPVRVVVIPARGEPLQASLPLVHRRGDGLEFDENVPEIKRLLGVDRESFLERHELGEPGVVIFVAERLRDYAVPVNEWLSERTPWRRLRGAAVLMRTEPTTRFAAGAYLDCEVPSQQALASWFSRDTRRGQEAYRSVLGPDPGERKRAAPPASPAPGRRRRTVSAAEPEPEQVSA